MDGMKSLSDLLARHPIPGIRQSAERHSCAEALQEILGLPVTAKQVKYESGVLSLTLPPIVKSALLAQQEVVKAALLSRGLSFVELR